MDNKQKIYNISDYKNIRPKLYDDFYGWCNFDWLNNNKIPDDETTYNHFIQVQLKIDNELKKILETNIFPLGTTLYNSFLNSEYRNSKCVDELKDLLKIINNVKSYDDLIQMAIRLLFINVNTLFSINIDDDIYSSCNNIMYLGEPLLGLPNKAYYHDNKYKEIKQEYYYTICKIYTELYPSYNIKKINEIASLLIEMESKLSIILLNPADKRDYKSIYHKVSLDTAIKLYPNIRLDKIIQILCSFSDNNIIEQNFRHIILEHHNDPSINYFKQLEQLLQSFSINQWKQYYEYNIILSYIDLTSDNMRNLYYNMFKKTLRGQKIEKPLWKNALYLSCSMFCEPISKIYSDNNFNSEIENYMKEMIKNIKKATKDRINKLEWMSEPTKKRAIFKLHKMKFKLGYSKSLIRNFDNITLTNSLIKNTIILNNENMIYQLNKLNSNIESDNWDLPSYIVNAYFIPTRNEIIFPASILQSPFLDITKSHIYNYGNIGSIIGHEIIHGFDDQGALYDENGSINNWWSNEDKLKYNEKVSKIVSIYESQGINGKLTAGENIADFGSVIMPLYGLQYKLDRNLNNHEIKKFYKTYAKHWQYIIRKEVAEESILTDVHSFANFRVNIPLMNQKLFQNVFKLRQDNKMYMKTEDILKIW
jgi:putative endopeptidase